MRVKLYKGNVIVVGRDSKTDSLFDPTIATFEDDTGAYDQKDAGGFIKLNALRMRIAAKLDAQEEIIMSQFDNVAVIQEGQRLFRRQVRLAHRAVRRRHAKNRSA